MTEQTATAQKGGLRITIDWIDSDGDSDDASRNRGIPPPSASRKGDELARSSHVRGGTCIHINVCLASPPSSAVKVKGDVSVDVRSSPNPGGDVCFVSPPPAAAKGKGRRDAAAKGTRRRDAATEADGELFSGMSDDELLREIAGLRNNTLRRFQPSLSRLSPHYEAKTRKRKEDACSRWAADHGDDVCFVSPSPAAAKGKRHTAAEAEAEGEPFQFQGMQNNMIRRFQPSLSRLSPHYEAEARKRKEDAYLRTFADLGDDVCFVSPPPAVPVTKGKRKRDAAAEAERELFSGMSNEGMRRDIAMMSDDELRREIAWLQLQPRLAERRRRLLPLLKAELRRRPGSTRTQDGDDRNPGARTSTAKPVPSLQF